MTDSVFALLVILGEGIGGMNRRGFVGSHWNLRSNWVLKKSDVMIWIWTNLRQRRNKIVKSKFGISVGHGDRAMVKGQSFTTRAGDLIEFIFAKESMLRLVKLWKNPWGFNALIELFIFWLWIFQRYSYITSPWRFEAGAWSKRTRTGAPWTLGTQMNSQPRRCFSISDGWIRMDN